MKPEKRGDTVVKRGTLRRGEIVKLADGSAVRLLDHVPDEQIVWGHDGNGRWGTLVTATPKGVALVAVVRRRNNGTTSEAHHAELTGTDVDRLIERLQAVRKRLRKDAT